MATDLELGDLLLRWGVSFLFGLVGALTGFYLFWFVLF